MSGAVEIGSALPFLAFIIIGGLFLALFGQS